MADTEGVILALAALGKTGQPACMAHAVHLLHTASQDFVGIGLVSHVPDYAVVGSVVDIVQGDREFHHSQPRAEVAAGLADAVQQIAAQFPGQLPELGLGQLAQGGSLVNGVQQGSGRSKYGDVGKHGRDSSAL